MIDLAALPLADAARLDGKPVRVPVRVGAPSYTWGGRTVIGTEEQPDVAERTAVIGGEHLDIDAGAEVIVAVTLRVIVRPACVVNGRFVPVWTEVQVTGRREPDPGADEGQ